MGKSICIDFSYEFFGGCLMSVFSDYSKYYDLLYADKDYVGEVEFIDSLLKQYTKNETNSLLELGSGTGKHAYYLAQKGYSIHGIDQSETMLAMASKLLSKAPREIAQRVCLEQGDVRHFRVDQKFDAAISLFHVLSYQTTNKDVEATFKTVKEQVKSGGLFLFDCWYGPAVLSQRPAVRLRQLQNECLRIERVAVPTLYENENRVTVNYHLFIQEQKNDFYQKLEESHPMRYFFLPELEHFCEVFGMKLELHCEWMTNRPLSNDTWGACFVVRVL